MNSNMDLDMKARTEKLRCFGFYGEVVLQQYGEEIRTALTTKSTKVLESLAKSKVWCVRAAVAMNPLCSCEIIHKYITKMFGRYRRSLKDRERFNKCFLEMVIPNRNCSVDTLDYIIGKLTKCEPWKTYTWERDQILYRIANNPNVSEEIQEFLLEVAMKSEVGNGIRWSLIKNPNTTSQILLKIWKHFERNKPYIEEYRMMWQLYREHKNCPSSIKDDIDYLESLTKVKVTTK